MLVRCSMARFLHTPTASSPCPSPPDCLSAVVYTHACTHTHTHTHTHGNEHFALTANAHLINLVQRAGLLIPVLTHQMICQRLLGPRLLLNLSNLPQATKADTKVQLFAMATTNPRTPAPARGAVFSVRASSPQGGIAEAVSAPPSQGRECGGGAGGHRPKIVMTIICKGAWVLTSINHAHLLYAFHGSGVDVSRFPQMPEAV